MVTRAIATLALAAALLAIANAASAQPAPTASAQPTPSTPLQPAPSAPREPRAHHAPPVTVSADAGLHLSARFDRVDRMKRALLVYKRGDAFVEVPFLRSSQADVYLAVVPPEHVVAPSFAYTIEIETVDGVRIAAFARRADPHVVSVMRDVTDAREDALLERLDGRRSVVSASAEYVYFGTTDAQVKDTSAGATALVTKRFADQYYRVEASYTYRFFRTVAEFGIRTGVVRGRSVVPNETDPTKFDVGLNYGAPRLRLRLHDYFHVEGEFLTSVTEVGFSVGGGGAIIMGDPYASRLTLGFESVQVFGNRGYSRFDLAATKRLIVAPMIELTDMPHAKSVGLRLLGEVRVEIVAGFGVVVRAGYQARNFDSGGPSGGVAAFYAF